MARLSRGAVLSESSTSTILASDQLPFVSVVLPSYNSRSTIAECLSSLQQQSYPRDRYEIIVADNGSRDGTLDVVRKQFPAVRIVTAQQKGSAYARNAGFAAARADLILSTDSDCVADPKWIEALVSAYQGASKDTAAVGGRIEAFSSANLIERYKKTWVGQPAADSTDVRYTATPNALFKAEAFHAVGGFDGSAGVFDDADLGIRLGKAGYQIAFTQEAVIRHRNPRGWKELYQHKRKYGTANYMLARSHPELLGAPGGRRPLSRLLWLSVRRLASDLVRLPLSLFSSRPGHPRGWPLVDAVIALGNYHGYREASRQDRRHAHPS